MATTTNLNKKTEVTIHGPSGDVKTNLGDVLKAAGLDTPKGRRTGSTQSVRKPASTDELAKQVSALAPVTKSTELSVIVPVKRTTHENVTIYVTKECVPGDETNTEYLCVVRTRTNPETGEITPDEKQNFGFDKSWCYYHGPRPVGDKPPPLDNEVWKKKHMVRSTPISGKFWCTYVPMSSVKQMLEGLRANFPGATLDIENKRHTL